MSATKRTEKNKQNNNETQAFILERTRSNNKKGGNKMKQMGKRSRNITTRKIAYALSLDVD